VVFDIHLLISWNVYSIDIMMLLGITDIFCGTIGYVDTLIFNNPAQLVFNHVFSF
jgi:hypothetical protein